jgi:O-antigen ligase
VGFASLQRLHQAAATGARYAAIGLGFATIVSTALTGVLSAVLLVTWLLGNRWRERLPMIRSNPVAVAGLALLALTGIGILWSQGSADEALQTFKKYLKLLLIPILATVMTERADRRRGLNAMAVGLVLTLVLSYAIWLEILPAMPPHIIGTPDDAVVFRKRISHNVFMAYGVLLFAVFAWQAASPRMRWVWSALAGLATLNVLVLVQGRTGYLVLAAMTVVALFTALRWRGVIAAAAAVSVAFAGAYLLSPNFKQRIDQIPSQAQQWDPSIASETSVGQRLEFYRNTAELIIDQPLIGVGTGGFPAAYAALVEPRGLIPTRHPHSQYLLTTAELGVVGLAALIFFFVQHGRAAARLAGAAEALLARGLLALMVVGCTVNSLLLDYAEGVFFAYLTGLLFAGFSADRPCAPVGDRRGGPDRSPPWPDGK